MRSSDDGDANDDGGVRPISFKAVSLRFFNLQTEHGTLASVSKISLEQSDFELSSFRLARIVLSPRTLWISRLYGKRRPTFHFPLLALSLVLVLTFYIYI